MELEAWREEEEESQVPKKTRVILCELLLSLAEFTFYFDLTCVDLLYISHVPCRMLLQSQLRNPVIGTHSVA